MAMGYAANSYLRVSDKLLEEIGYKDAYEKLEELADMDEDYEIQSSCMNCVQCTEFQNSTCEADVAFYQYFKEVSDIIEAKLKVKPYLIFHDADEHGDRYDDINGFAFVFMDDQIYQVKPELSGIEEHIEFANFVSFG